MHYAFAFRITRTVPGEMKMHYRNMHTTWRMNSIYVCHLCVLLNKSVAKRAYALKKFALQSKKKKKRQEKKVTKLQRLILNLLFQLSETIFVCEIISYKVYNFQQRNSHSNEHFRFTWNYHF